MYPIFVANEDEEMVKVRAIHCASFRSLQSAPCDVPYNTLILTETLLSVYFRECFNGWNFLPSVVDGNSPTGRMGKFRY